MPLFYLFLFILGAVIGSFLSVVSERYKVGQPLFFNLKVIGGRSRCPKCQAPLSWPELIPIISFLIQKGKCRHCKKSISLRYPIIEILSGLVLAILPIYFYKSFNIFFLFLGGESITWYYWFLGIWIVAAFIFILLSMIDIRLSVIPDQLNLCLAVLGLALIIVKDYFNQFGMLQGSFLGSMAMMFGWRENIWINHLAAVLLVILFFSLIIFVSRGRAMGMGDLKLAAAIGLLLGWPDTIMALLLAFIVGALVGIILILLGKETLKSAIPFGPYLAIAVFINIFFGRFILEGYFRLFGL
jgi:prepilin signal peptidase PulO-like enzyme (type II secretory pathway)